MDFMGSVKNLSSFVYERASSPFVWVFLICFVFNHWDDLLVLLLSDDNIHEKVEYVRRSINNSMLIIFSYSTPSPYFYVLNPLISAIVVSFLYPMMSIMSAFVNDFAVTARNQISRAFDSNKFLSKEVSNELREERERLFETFDKQLEETRKQLRESQNQFVSSQINSSALFCALAFSKGYESLLPYTDLASSFIAATPEQRDMLLAIHNTSLPQNNALKVESVINSASSFEYLHSLQKLDKEDFIDLIKELSARGAITIEYRKRSNFASDLSLDSLVKLTVNGRTFVEIITSIANGRISRALEIKKT